MSQNDLTVTNPQLLPSYCNISMVGWKQEEFILDLGIIAPGQPNATLVARVLMSPYHFKKFVDMLNTNLQLYEQQYGKMTIHGEGPDERDIHPGDE
jgi:hypothetical protein